MTTSLTYEPRIDPVSRALVTIGALIVLFIGTHIPLPGLSAELLRRIPPGPPLGRLSIFALGVTPVIFARVILEFLRLTIPRLGRWIATPNQTAEWIRFGRGLALALAGVQAYGVALALENMTGFVDEAGWAFRLGIVVTAVGATALLIALADFVTRNGVGDGLLILLATPVIARATPTFTLWVELGRTGAIPAELPFAAAALTLVALALLVAASLAQPRAPGPEGQARLANANLDVWPPLLATSILGLLVAAAALALGRAPLPTSALMIAYTLALAGLIALFAMLRAQAAGARAPNLWPTTIAEMAVCVGAALFAYSFGISSETAGFWIVCAAAAALSCFSRSVRL
jgi:preprotein translocase subunit SecY